MNISWDNIDKLEDHYITYLLYKESRTVSQISKIRNLSTSQVNDQLIKAKLEIKSMLKDKVELSKDVIDKFLVLNKNDRLKSVIILSLNWTKNHWFYYGLLNGWSVIISNTVLNIFMRKHNLSGEFIQNHKKN